MNESSLGDVGRVPKREVVSNEKRSHSGRQGRNALLERSEARNAERQAEREAIKREIFARWLIWQEQPRRFTSTSAFFESLDMIGGSRLVKLDAIYKWTKEWERARKMRRLSLEEGIPEGRECDAGKAGPSRPGML